jgi:uroporphyrinogen decarboxylase
MTGRDIMHAAIKRIPTGTVPYSLKMDDGVVRNLNQYYGGTEWQQQIRRFHTGVAGIDTLHEREQPDGTRIDGFGSIWRADVPGAPALTKPVLPHASFDRFSWPDASLFAEPIYQRLDEFRARSQDLERYRVISMGWGIFEQSWRMRGFENALADMILEPDFYHELTGRICEYYMAMLRVCRDIPADGYLMGDDWGMQSGTIMSPDLWRTFLKPHWRRITEEIHTQGKTLICHSCGSVEAIIPDIIEIGIDCLESVQPESCRMNPYELKRKYGNSLSFWGCLGNQSLIQFGTPAEIKAEIRRLKQEMGQGGGFILAAAKSLQDETPVENAVAVFEAFTE